MATLSMLRNHSLQLDVVRARLIALVNNLAKSYNLQGHWAGNTMTLVGSGSARGITGRVDVTPTHVSVAVDLPGLLALAKGKIEREIGTALDEVLK